MKDEIKEILEFDFQSQGERIEINEYERDILKDYITNLQEEINRTKLKNTYLINELNECMIERNNYLSRNEKAIEYIKKRTEFSEYDYAYPGVLNQDEVRKLRNILEEDDKE